MLGAPLVFVLELTMVDGVFGDRHGECHGEIGLGMRYSCPPDGDDAHDGELQAYSR